jgi:deoxyhypusine synthase
MRILGFKVISFPTLLLLFGFFGSKPSAYSQTPDSISLEYERRILLSRIDDVYIPKDVLEALKELSNKTSEESRIKMRDLPEDKVVELMEFRLGLWIKKNWSFVLGSRLLHDIKGYGPQSPDEAVEFLLIAWHRYLNDSPLHLELLGSDIYKRRIEAFEKRKAEAKIIHTELRPLSEEEKEELSKMKRNY